MIALSAHLQQPSTRFLSVSCLRLVCRWCQRDSSWASQNTDLLAFTEVLFQEGSTDDDGSLNREEVRNLLWLL